MVEQESLSCVHPGKSRKDMGICTKATLLKTGMVEQESTKDMNGASNKYL
jgi:hypothetical protein